MFNPIAYGVDALNNTSSATLGYGPGNVLPPRLLVNLATVATQITLPPISTLLPTPPSVPGTTVGTGQGFMLTLRNQSGQNLTVVPAAGDTIADPLYLNAVGACENLMVSFESRTWYKTVNPNGAGGIRTAAGPATIATTDRYIIVSAAAAITLPAPSNFPSGTPFVTLINTSGGNLTVTPASGTIQTQAAFTIATLKEATILTDGTNFYLSAQ